MRSFFSLILLGIACFGTLTSTVFLVLVMRASARFRREARTSSPAQPSATLPPVSLLKPLHGAEPGLCEYLESFFALDYPEFELLFCARTEEDAGLRLAREVAAKHPERAVRFLTSGKPPWPNARCYSLSLMAPVAAHELLVITDSDVLVEPGFLRAVVAPFADANVAGMTCLYRGKATGMGLWALMEGLGMSVEMTAGVVVANMLEGMRFMLGPAMAVTRTALDEVGGFARLGYYYADDFMMGNLVSEKHRVALSSHIIDHCIVNNGFAANFRHQWNWAKSTRFSRPWGHLGTGLTFAAPFGLLGLLGGWLSGHLYVGVALLVWAYLSRVLLCLVAGAGVVRDPDAVRFCWLYPLRDLMGATFWAMSYLSRKVGWRDDMFVLEKEGLMRKING